MSVLGHGVEICTTATRPASAPNGTLIFDTDVSKLLTRVGSNWEENILENYFNSFINIKQVLSVNYDTEYSTTSTSFQNTGLNLSITPSSANSKILVIATTPVRADNSPNTGYYEAVGMIALLRGSSTYLQSHNFGVYLYEGGGKRGYAMSSFVYLDQPNTTSSVNYKTMIRSTSTSFRAYANNTEGYVGVNLPVRRSQMILIELI